MVLIIKHGADERLGTLAHFMSDSGEKTLVADLQGEAALPPSLEGVEGVISLGTDGDIDEAGWHPAFHREIDLVRAATAREIPFLGIGLGALAVTWATGGEVTRTGSPEKGWQSLRLTTVGRRDPLLRWIPGTVEAFTWSHAAIVLPPGATLLIEGSRNPNQAFRMGSALGILFHLEVNRELIGHWFPGDPDLPRMRNALETYRTLHDAQSHTIYRNFMATVAKRRRAT